MIEPTLRPAIEAAWDRRDTLSPTTTGADRDAILAALAALDAGTLRVATPTGDGRGNGG